MLSETHSKSSQNDICGRQDQCSNGKPKWVSELGACVNSIFESRPFSSIHNNSNEQKDGWHNGKQSEWMDDILLAATCQAKIDTSLVISSLGIPNLEMFISADSCLFYSPCQEIVDDSDDLDNEWQDHADDNSLHPSWDALKITILTDSFSSGALTPHQSWQVFPCEWLIQDHGINPFQSAWLMFVMSFTLPSIVFQPKKNQIDSNVTWNYNLTRRKEGNCCENGTTAHNDSINDLGKSGEAHDESETRMTT